MAKDSRLTVHPTAPHNILERRRIIPRPRSANSNTSIDQSLSSGLASVTATGNIRAAASQNSFFEASKNVQISGGHFNSIQDHHFSGHNVIINLYGNSRVEDAMEILRSNETIPLLRSNPVFQHDPPKMKPYAIADFDELSEVTPVGQSKDPLILSQTHDQIPSESLPTVQVNEKSEVYYRQLITKRRGSPLWVPEPSDTLPVEYQRRGIGIGDVGIITDFGGFEYMFNICMPEDDPINPDAMPEEFRSLNPPLEHMDIREYSAEFNADSYLASSVVRVDPTGLTFVSTASEGALLIAPNGSRSNDLANVTSFMKYASTNVEKWYKYAKEACGCAVRNGDLRLVVGHDKASAWGLTSFTNLPEHHAFRFKFKPISENSFGRVYGWEHHGTDEARSGPDVHQVEKLKASDQAEDSAAYENQCLFVRTLNITFHENTWERLVAEGIGAANSETPQALDEHPSKTINELLLKERPSAKIAITQDWDWISVIEMYDSLLPPPETLFTRILAVHDICEEEGTVFLMAKATSILVPSLAPQPESTPADTSHGDEIEPNVPKHALNDTRPLTPARHNPVEDVYEDVGSESDYTVEDDTSSSEEESTGEEEEEGEEGEGETELEIQRLIEESTGEEEEGEEAEEEEEEEGEIELEIQRLIKERQLFIKHRPWR